MKAAAAPFLVTAVLVVMAAISGQMTCSRIGEYLDAREVRRRHHGEVQQDGDRDVGYMQGDPERSGEAIAIYVGWGIDAAQAFVAGLAPPALFFIGLQLTVSAWLGLVYVLSSLLGLALFAWVLTRSPDVYIEKARFYGLLTPVVGASLVLNLVAFLVLQFTRLASG